MSRPDSVHGRGGNKLRTYSLLKSEYEAEEYVCNGSIKFPDRRAMAQLRCGSAPIGIETGRYKNGVHLPAHERICEICGTSVEDEVHVIMKCNLYDDLRDDLFDAASSINPSFPILCDMDKFVFLMCHKSMVKFSAKTCRLILQRRRSFMTQ